MHPTLSHNERVAALDEMRFWVHIFAEHFKFHRGGLDPSDEQEPLFRTLDAFANRIEFLHRQIEAIDPDSPAFLPLLRRTIYEVTAVRNFKIYLYEATKNCKVLTIIPPPLTDHMRRETDRLLGILRHLLGYPAPTRNELGIPDGNRRVQALPRLLIPQAPANVKFTDVLEEIMFFSRISAEHSWYLANAVKPVGQEAIREQALNFQGRFEANIVKAKQVEQTGQGFEAFVRSTRALAQELSNVLGGLHHALETCSVPGGGQLNTWPHLIEHVHHETEFFLGILDLALQ